MLRSVTTFCGSTLYPEIEHFQLCILNIKKIKVFLCYCKVICTFLLICFKVYMCKISDKSDKSFCWIVSIYLVHFFSRHIVYVSCMTCCCQCQCQCQSWIYIVRKCKASNALLLVYSKYCCLVPLFVYITSCSWIKSQHCESKCFEQSLRLLFFCPPAQSRRREN